MTREAFSSRRVLLLGTRKPCHATHHVAATRGAGGLEARSPTAQPGDRQLCAADALFGAANDPERE